MAFSVTQPNFNGKAAGFYINAALNEAKSLTYLTVMENVKYKENIQKMAGSSLIVNGDCNAFTSSGNLALTETTLTPKDLQVNLAICKKTLITSYEALQMRAGRDAGAPVAFEDYVISYIGEIIANGTETSIWTGNDASAGEFTGFVGGGVGHLVTDGTVVDVAKTGATIDATNIVTNLSATLEAVPSAVYMKEDLHIYMSAKSFRLYIQKMSQDGYVNAYSMNRDYEAVFEGVRLAVCPGMKDNVLVAAEKSNLFFGTDLLSDSTRISILDQALVTGSDNINVVARYTAGTIQGIGSDIVLTS